MQMIKNSELKTLQLFLLLDNVLYNFSWNAAVGNNFFLPMITRCDN